MDLQRIKGNPIILSRVGFVSKTLKAESFGPEKFSFFSRNPFSSGLW